MNATFPVGFLIPLPAGKFTWGKPTYRGWTKGDRFYYYDSRFEFLGIDDVGGLHARNLDNGRLTAFESTWNWKRL